MSEPHLPPPRATSERASAGLETNQERAQRLFKELRAQLNTKTFRDRAASMVPQELRTTGYIDRLCEGAFAACRDNKELLLADRASLFRAIERVAKSGLTVGAGGYWLVPWKGEVQEQLDYRGALTLVRRSKMVRKISVQVVYENDRCEIQLGTDEKIDHRPSLGSRGGWVAAYAFAWVEGVDSPEVEVMDREQIEHVRDLSPSKNSPAWRSYPDEMARKVVLKRLCKRLPLENPDALKDIDDRTIEGVGETINAELPVRQITQEDEVPIGTVGHFADDRQDAAKDAAAEAMYRGPDEPQEQEQQPKRRGRPPGSSNRPKPPTALDQPADGETIDEQTGEVTEQRSQLPFEE